MVPGHRYFMPNISAGMVLQDTRTVTTDDGREVPLFSVASLHKAEEQPFDPSQDWNNRDIFLFRAGGFGDLLFLTPSIREMKKRWPDCRIKIVCAAEYKDALIGLPVEWVAMPLCADEIAEDAAAVFFEGLIEYNPEAEHVHAVDLFSRKLGLGDLEHRLDWVWQNGEIDYARIKFPYRRSNKAKTGERINITKIQRIGIQAAASSVIRSYPAPLMSELVSLLIDKGYEVFIFGKKGQISCSVAGVTNLCDHDLTMRQSVAIMSTCDVMITPDSALFHIAQAIGVPSVALFGPFPAHLRSTTGPSIILQAEADCAPCFFHASTETHFPHNKPCSLAKFCTVMASIMPEAIVEAVEDLLIEHC